MSLIFADSFDHYNASDLGNKWSSASGAWTKVAGRFGGNAMGGGLGISAIFAGNFFKINFTAASTLVVGAAVNITAVAQVSDRFFKFKSGGTEQTGVTVNPDNTLSIIEAGTNILATSTIPIALGTFNYIEFSTTFANAISAHTCQLKINGQLAAEASAGANTNPAGSTHADSFSCIFPFFIPGDGAITFDDFYICNGSGSTNNSFLGDISVTALFPNGNGAENDFINDASNSTNNYSHINANPSNDGTTFVESSVPGNIDLYTFGSLSFSGTVLSVQQVLQAEKSDSGARTFAPVIRLSNTDYIGSATTPTTSYLFYSYPNDVRPSDSMAWTTTDVNNAQYGIKLVS